MESKALAIHVRYSVLARPQVGTTWGYWDRTCFMQDVRYNEAFGLGYDENVPARFLRMASN
jgi:hypothetical protein